MSSLDGRPGFNRQILEALHEKHAEDPVIRLTATRSTRSPYSSRMLAIVTRSNRNANRLRRSVWLPVTRRPPPRGGGGGALRNLDDSYKLAPWWGTLTSTLWPAVNFGIAGSSAGIGSEIYVPRDWLCAPSGAEAALDGARGAALMER